MGWIGEMLVRGLSDSIDDNADEAVKSAERRLSKRSAFLPVLNTARRYQKWQLQPLFIQAVRNTMTETFPAVWAEVPITVPLEKEKQPTPIFSARVT